MANSTQAERTERPLEALVGPARLALERLEYYLDALDSYCDCEDCPECGKRPHECSGTECAQTCQCRYCDRCLTLDAAEALRQALPPNDKSSAQSAD